MSFLVLPQVGGGLEHLAALPALVLGQVPELLQGVRRLVLLHVALLRERPAADVASVRLLPRVHPVCLKI